MDAEIAAEVVWWLTGIIAFVGVLVSGVSVYHTARAAEDVMMALTNDATGRSLFHAGNRREAAIGAAQTLMVLAVMQIIYRGNFPTEASTWLTKGAFLGASLAMTEASVVTWRTRRRLVREGTGGEQ